MADKPQGEAAPVRAWGDLELAPDRTTEVRIGELELLLSWHDGEVRIAHYHVSQDPSWSPPDADSLSWQRFAVESGKVSIVPALPDRSIVVQAESPFWIPSGGKTTVYVRVPLWVQVRAQGGATLVDLPSVVLSNTWFGTFTEGELCYWISSSVRRQAVPDPAKNYSALAPVEITNEAKENLFIDYFCLRVPYLSLYDDGQQFWTDASLIAYRGPGSFSRFRVSGKRPRIARTAKLVTGPREVLRKATVLKVFAQAGELPGLGVRFT